MDFASLMSKEISKAAPSKSAAASDKKYQKRADLEAERRAAYEAEQAAIAAEREARAAKKRKIEEEEAELLRQREEKKRRLAEETRAKREAAAKEEERLRRKRLGLPDLVEEEKSTKDTEAVDGDDIDDEELYTKLREMGEPVTLFGEGHKQRLKRYRRLYDAKQLKLSSGPIPTTLELVPESEMKVPAKMPTDLEGQKYVTRQLASYFTMVLREWEEAMEKEKQDTSTSRTAYIAMTQTRENMKPLFRQFENGSLDTSLLSSITEIVLAAQERRYVDANDGYLRLSIGKAAWPIGVTMVGIHERSAREKLHETDKGHVMGDEATRKFMQSIKRCLSFAQVRWPPEDLRQLMG